MDANSNSNPNAAPMTAEDLMRAHFEGAEDPFPSLTTDSPVKKAPKKQAVPFDTESEISFPTLASAAPAARPATTAAAQPAVAWGPRIKGTIARTPAISDTLALSVLDLNRAAGKDGKPPTLGEVMKGVMAKTKTKIEASTQRTTGVTTFLIKGDSEKDVEQTKRLLIVSLSPQVAEKYEVPMSTVPMIIGSKGATLKEIRDHTGTRIDIPRRDTLTTGDQRSSNAPTRSATPSNNDEEDEPTVPITITGPKPSVDEAKEMIHNLIAHRISKTTQRIRDIPEHIYPFIVAEISKYDHTVPISFNSSSSERTVAVQGDREHVVKAVEELKAKVSELSEGLIKMQVQVPKNKHRFLTGGVAEEIMNETQCSVLVNPDAGDFVEIWADPMKVGDGVKVVMQRVAKYNVQTVSLPAPITYSKQIHAYLTGINYIPELNSRHLNTDIHIPDNATVQSIAPNSKTPIGVDFLSENKQAVEAAAKEFKELVKKLEGGIRAVEVESVKHPTLKANRQEQFDKYKTSDSVLVIFPDPALESSSVLLVLDPTGVAAGAKLPQKQKTLDRVQREITKLVQEAGEFKSEVITVEKKWHPKSSGWPRKNPLAPIVDEETKVSIQFGPAAARGSVPQLEEDSILVRGPAADVKRATEKLLAAAEQAKIDEIEGGHVIEFEIDRAYASRVIGAQGAALNRLRDRLDVQIDVNDSEDKDSGDLKKKKSVQKSKVKITGRKEKIEEAKKSIQQQISRLADETQEILKIPRQFHASLIGPGGKYVTRLEDKYDVKITFPRDEEFAGGEGKASRVDLKPNEVLVKGGKKGVAGCKDEIMEAYEYEKANNLAVEFTVPTRAVARILGKSGSQVNQIKDDTGAQIDIDKASESTNDVTRITVRGTKESTESAKKAIMAIANQVDDEATVTISIENKYHGTIIGAGGQGLRDLIAKVGGPTESRAQAGLIHFPRQGEPGDEVRLRGPKTVVNKLKVELEKIATSLRDRVIMGVAIPSTHHRALIGRGGQTLNQLQERTNTTIYFPGSRSYNQVAEPLNAADLKDANPQDIVKVTGLRAACEKAIEELEASKPAETIQKIVNVPSQYFHTISQQGNFFRQLRNWGVTVDHPTPPKPAAVRPAVAATDTATTARIDEDSTSDPSAGPVHRWSVVENKVDADGADAEWTLHAQNAEGLAKAERAISEAIAQAKTATHTGFLTVEDRSIFPRIIGTKGANVARLREKTGADITIPRDDDTIVIVGSEQALEQVKKEILQIGKKTRSHD